MNTMNDDGSVVVQTFAKVAETGQVFNKTFIRKVEDPDLEMKVKSIVTCIKIERCHRSKFNLRSQTNCCAVVLAKHKKKFELFWFYKKMT